jgi:glucose-1-phosphate thymidylyltransferase
MIKGIIPAAGRGTRLYPYPGNKEMYPMGYDEDSEQERLKVISEFVLSAMLEAGAEIIYWIINHNKSDLIQYYGNGSRFGVKFVYLVQEEMVGMPQAINQATHFINKDDIVLFGMPDTIFKPDNCFKVMSNKCHINTDDIYTGKVFLGTFPTENYWKFGMCKIEDKNINTYQSGKHSISKINTIIDKPNQNPGTKWAWGNAVWGYDFQKFLSEYINDFENQNDPYEIELVLGDIFRDYDGTFAFKFKKGDYFDIGTTGELKKTLDYFNK